LGNKKNNMNVGIIVTTHQGSLRTNGQQLIDNFVNSCNAINSEYKVYVYDNSSETPITLDNQCVTITYVEDQTVRGLTGTWNDGVNQAVQDGCDIIIVSNDDVTINDTINNFISNITDDNTIYGPTSDGILSGVQKQSKPGNGTIDLTNNKSNMLNGFFFGFTRNFVYNYIQTNKQLFNEDYPWGGNEEEFQLRTWKQGAKSLVIKSCWLQHVKIRGWKQLQ